MDETVSDAIDELEKSPMWAMSLSSRELFHSNFLAWLFEKSPSALSVFGIEGLEECCVKREDKNVDIVIYRKEGDNCPKKGDAPLLILENKVKDIPRADQLISYAGKFPGAQKRILLSLAPPLFDLSTLEGGSWDGVLYKKLAQKLRAWLKTEAGLDAHSRFYVEDYVALIERLSLIGEEYFKVSDVKTHYWFGSSGAFKALDEIGFGQTLKKYQAGLFADEISRHLGQYHCVVRNKKERPNTPHLFVWTALFNNTPCVTIVPSLGLDDTNSRLEIQIQGNQYRHIFGHADIDNHKRSKERDLFIEELKNVDAFKWLFGESVKSDVDGKFFDVCLGDGKMRRITTAMRGDFCGYGKRTAYQYLSIADTKDGMRLPLSELTDWITRDVTRAFEVLGETPEP